MFYKPFTGFVPNDGNRIEDGRDLRTEFLDLFKIDDIDPDWIDLEVSVLEVLIALSRRGSFETGDSTESFFWLFMDNLDLRVFTDSVYKQDNWADVDVIIDRFVDRTYKRNGEGGIFPLRHATKDQRKVELWYQQAAYLLENYEF